MTDRIDSCMQLPSRRFPHHRRRRIAPVALLATLAALAAPLVATSGAQAAGRALPDLSQRTLGAKRMQLDTLLARAPHAHGLRCTATVSVPGQGPSCAAGDGMWIVQRGSHRTMTHGPDVLNSSRAFARIAASGGAPVIPAGATGDVDCVGSGKHIRLVYAYTADDTLDAAVPGLLQQAFYTMGRYVNDQAKTVRASASVHFRTTCDGGGNASVDTVHLPHAASWYSANGFDSIVTDLKEHTSGQGNPTDRASNSTRLLVFYASDFNGGYAGQGTLWSDDSPGSDNWNNASPSDASAAINYDAYEDNLPDWSTMLHETGHNNGAVQDSEDGYNTISAPNASEGGHCIDGHDIMCYADGGSREKENNYEACPTPEYPEEGAFDCGKNDYFNPAPRAGSYLAGHWNMASTANGWVDFSAGTASGAGAAPTAPGAPSGDTVTETGSYDDTPWDTVSSLRGRWTYLRLNWAAATDDVAVHYRVEELRGISWTVLGVTDGTSYTPSSLTCSASHTVRVVSFDDDGNETVGPSGTASTGAQGCHGSTSSGNAGDAGDTDDTGGMGGGDTGGSGGGSGGSGGSSGYTGNGGPAAMVNQGPTAPSALVGRTSSTSVSLSWLAAADPDGSVDHYEVLADASPDEYELLATTSGTAATVRNLQPRTAYRLYVVAVDDAGAEGDVAFVDVRTSGDTSPPTRAKVRVKHRTRTSVTVTFSARDAHGIARYVVQERVGKRKWKVVRRLRAKTRTLVIKRLPRRGKIQVRVLATDKAGNTSVSKPLTVRRR